MCLFCKKNEGDSRRACAAADAGSGCYGTEKRAIKAKIEAHARAAEVMEAEFCADGSQECRAEYGFDDPDEEPTEVAFDDLVEMLESPAEGPKPSPTPADMASHTASSDSSAHHHDIAHSHSNDDAHSHSHDEHAGSHESAHGHSHSHSHGHGKGGKAKRRRAAHAHSHGNSDGPQSAAFDTPWCGTCNIDCVSPLGYLTIPCKVMVSGKVIRLLPTLHTRPLL